MNIAYAVKRIFRMDIKRTFADVARVAKKSNKNSIVIFLDMLYCGIKYGAGPLDYDLFEFYNLNAKQRETYVTRGVNNALVKKFNNRDYWHIFDNKNEFNETFKEFIHRDWLLTDNLSFDKFEKFSHNKQGFIYKPIDGTCGRGIEKILFKDTPVKKAYEYLCTKSNGIIEEIIIQNSEISKMYPLAINTIRVVTIFQNGIVTPVFAFWRIGNNGKFVDNLNSGGMAAMLNLEDGSISLPAADKNGITYESHPYSNKKIVGYKLPMWNEIIYTVSKAAKVLPQVGYVGWDVALSEDSIQIIEGNCFPGHDILQLPAYTPTKIGLKHRVEKFLN